MIFFSQKNQSFFTIVFLPITANKKAATLKLLPSEFYFLASVFFLPSYALFFAGDFFAFASSSITLLKAPRLMAPL